MHICVHVCMQRPEETSRWPALSLSSPLVQGLSLNLKLGGGQHAPVSLMSLSTHPGTGITGTCDHSWLFMWDWGLELLSQPP